MTRSLLRGDVVLVSFPFVVSGQIRRKMRPALVIQSDRYNAKRAVVIVAALTSSQVRLTLPCKVPVLKDTTEGRAAGLRIDSVIDCQTIVTLPRAEIVRRIGALPAAVMARVDAGIRDALGLASTP